MQGAVSSNAAGAPRTGVRWGAALAVAATVGCSEAPPSTYDSLPELRRVLAPYALSIEPSSRSMAHLAYRPPTASCPQVYRITTSYEPPLLHEDATTSHVALGHVLRRKPSQRDREDDVFEGELVYSGVRAEARAVVRDWWLSDDMAGPAAPTAACFPRTWDPIEDGFSLGWPRLPGGPTAVGETWPGLRVEGKCNRSACVDPQTGGGGPDNHHRTCVTMSWQETLSGVYEIGGHRVALVGRSWSDGHGEAGIRTEGIALHSIDHGRPIWARVIVHHAFPQLTADDRWAPIRRTWTLEALDDCPGSLTDLGWQRPAEADDALDGMLDTLASAAELRAGGKRSRAPRREGAPQQNLEQGDADVR